MGLTFHILTPMTVGRALLTSIAGLFIALAPAHARVSDHQWGLVKTKVERAWATDDHERRAAALEQLGFADRPEATTWLARLVGELSTARAQAERDRNWLRGRAEANMAERERMSRLLQRRNWTDEEDAAYRVIERRVDRQLGELRDLEKALFQSERLEFVAVRALATHTDLEARATRMLALDGATGDHARGLIEALALAGDREALPRVRARIADPDPNVAHAAILACTDLGDTAAGDAITAVLDHPRWRVRCAAIRALGALGTQGATGALVTRAERASGREAEDALASLVRITGFDHETPAAWRTWFDANRERLATAIAERKVNAADVGRSIGPVAFYGLRTMSRKIAFAIDTSGSMGEPAGPVDPAVVAGATDYPRDSTKLGVAKYELRRAMAAMPEGTRFNLVYFTSNVKIAEADGLITATPDNVRKLSQWLRHEVDAAGGTDVYGGLRRALAMADPPPTDDAPGSDAPPVREDEAPGIDTIYFLSDGAPSTGLLKDYPAILDDITRRNRRLGVAIHVVGVGRAVDAEFLAALAGRNGGRFLHTQK